MRKPDLHLALREWRQVFSRPVTALVIAGVAGVLTIIGPFETGTRLMVLPRFLYWATMSAATYGAGLMVSLVLWSWLETRFARPLVAVILGIGTGAVITPLISLINLLTFGYWPSLVDWPTLLVQYFGIAVLVSTIIQALSWHLARAVTEGAAAPASAAPPALLTRLPLDKRGAILSLSAEDHYTRVRTTRGETLVLLRLADAMAESSPVDGLQVHRSHWVAVGAVTSTQRQGDGAVLRLVDDTTLPVSRRHMPALRAAGLIER